MFCKKKTSTEYIFFVIYLIQMAAGQKVKSVNRPKCWVQNSTVFKNVGEPGYRCQVSRLSAQLENRGPNVHNILIISLPVNTYVPLKDVVGVVAGLKHLSRKRTSVQKMYEFARNVKVNKVKERSTPSFFFSRSKVWHIEVNCYFKRKCFCCCFYTQDFVVEVDR